MSNPKVGGQTVEASIRAMELAARHPGHRYWPIIEDGVALIAPFSNRIYGHQQVTDALLLGLAVKENGVLVTMDKGIRHLAGNQYSKHLLVLEP